MAQDERFDHEYVEEQRSLSTTIAIATGPALGAATAWALNKYGGSDNGEQAPAGDPPPTNPPSAEQKE